MNDGLQLEHPVRVSYDTYDRGHYRYIVVQLSEAQSCRIEALEANELQRLHAIQNTEKASNIYFRECRLHVPKRVRNLNGCMITLVVRPGPFRNRRGRTVVDLFANDIKVIRRTWFCWRV